MVGHDGELGPVAEEVGVGVEGVGLGQLFAEDIDDPVEFCL